ncbi:two-partner secretion domain-containing protein [Leptolyngbya ohadii]|uniref:two-partner secretion domain-containing protein n=1 Tax=Leptolyngbya ohadii TaxID=1962290 RepID=UPI000B598E6F|nr:filamentous hemagglutinin N-terminal domain-containing protein [Leptolyngbya ohadii]
MACRSLVLLLTSGIVLINPCSALAQILPDNSLGRERSILQRDVPVNGARGDQIEGGSRRGGNLFHSFETFNVTAGQRVYFASPNGIDRILARVTGKGRSTINGTLGALGTADLFLINPNGILFGSNARLDVGGSFLASSASAVEFGDRGRFSSNSAQPPSPLLTIQPTALLFNSLPRPIVNRSIASDLSSDSSDSSVMVGLQVPAGQSLLLLGGDVRLEGGVLTAPGGRVELAAAAGTVPLLQTGQNWRILPSVRVQGEIVLQNQAAIQVASADRGNVALYSEGITLQNNSGIVAGIGAGLGTPDSQAGNVTLDATGAIQIQDSVIANVVSSGGRGNAGNIRLRADTISLSDRAQIQTSSRSQGNAGDLFITTGSLSLTGNSGLFATTSDRGNAGSISIRAQDAVVFDQSFASTTVDPEAIGQGGRIELTAGSLSLLDGAVLASDIFGRGRAGDIDLTIDGQIKLEGSDSQGNFGSITTVIGIGGQGQAGTIRIQADSMTLTQGGGVVSNTGGQGDAGDIWISLNDRLEISGQGADGTPSGIYTTVGLEAIGDGGDIFITTDELSMRRSLITAASGGQGNAGNIDITAQRVQLDDAIIATTGRTENGGNLTFRDLNLLLLNNGGIITTATQVTGAEGNGGNLSIDSDVIAADPDEDNDIAANAEGGRGGNINITTQGIFGIESRPERSTNTNDINASSRLNVSGTVTINAPAVSPIAGTVNLPTDFSTPPLAQSCQSQGNGSRFVNTGRGGLPANPTDPLVAEALWQDLGDAEPDAIDSVPQAVAPPLAEGEINFPQEFPVLVEAQGWTVTSTGEVALVASAPIVTPSVTFYDSSALIGCDSGSAHE